MFVLIFLIFLVGLLLGAVAGAMLCVRYLRQEIAGNVGPQLRRIQNQLDTLAAEINLVLETRHAEISARLTRDATRQAQ
jgi:uncharacterized membrane-anchored protein YhcB (DUF1043 family)